MLREFLNALRKEDVDFNVRVKTMQATVNGDGIGVMIRNPDDVEAENNVIESKEEVKKLK